jgi:hypothetical protein
VANQWLKTGGLIAGCSPGALSSRCDSRLPAFISGWAFSLDASAAKFEIGKHRNIRIVDAEIINKIHG